MSNKQTLLKGAMVLGVAGIIVKLLGATFRLPLVNWIGDIGMANYGPAYYIYAFLVVLATSGIPVAISRLVSESIALGNHNQAHKIFKIAVTMLFAIGVVFFVFLYGFADSIAGFMKNPDAALGMRAISPALILVPVMAAFRGYFQGMHNMRPTAVSNIVEQFFRVVIGLSAAYYMFFVVGSDGKYDKYVKGAAGANFGATAGAIGGLLIMVFIYMLAKDMIKKNVARSANLGTYSGKTIMSKIIVIALPITIGAGIMPILNIVDSAMVVNRLLSAGIEPEIAKSLYGQLSGFVGSLISFPQIIIQSIAVSSVPIIAAAYKMRDKKAIEKNIFMGIRTSVIIGYPAAVGLMTLSKPILTMLYPRQLESAESASSILFIMAFGLIFLATSLTLIGILQGMGKQVIPVKNMMVGMIFKIVLTWVLVGIPMINVNGAAIGTITAYMVSMFLNFKAVLSYTKVRIDYGLTFVRPIICSLTMGVSVLLTYKIGMMLLGKNSIATLMGVIVGVITYVVMIFITKTIREDEIINFPKGDKLLKIIKKFSR